MLRSGEFFCFFPSNFGNALVDECWSCCSCHCHRRRRCCFPLLSNRLTAIWMLHVSDCNLLSLVRYPCRRWLIPTVCVTNKTTICANKKVSKTINENCYFAKGSKSFKCFYTFPLMTVITLVLYFFFFLSCIC